MLMANVIGGISMVEADEMRKAMKKKDHNKMQSFRHKFITGALNNGIETQAAAEGIWDKIESWSNYGFCLAHAAAYAQISYQGMFFKLLFSHEFYVGILEHSRTKELLPIYYRDIKKHGIPVITPDVNRSREQFYTDGTSVVWSLSGIKGVNEASVSRIVQNGPYTDMADFVKRSAVDKRTADSLIHVSAFPWSTGYDAAKDYYRVRGEPLPAVYTVEHALHWERLFASKAGFFRKSYEEMFPEQIRAFGKLDTFSDFEALGISEDAKIIGRIDRAIKIVTKRGDPMMILKIDLESNSLSVVVWPSFFKNHKISGIPSEDLMDTFVFIFGRKDMDPRGEDQITLSDVRQERLDFLS
jgi:DNA polymerase III alpha subunit